MSSKTLAPSAPIPTDTIQPRQRVARKESRPAVRIEKLSKAFSDLLDINYLSLGETWSHIKRIFSAKEPGSSLSPLQVAKGQLSIPALEIEAGSIVCITGPSGSGKSVFLQILAGFIPPSEGRIELDGDVASLLDPGSNLDLRWTARQNVKDTCQLEGLSPAEIDEAYRSVLDFAGLQAYEHLKVYEYSSGMKLRLGVALSLRSSPDIWLIDDVLGVADLKFQIKCKELLRSMRHSGRTIVFASHDEALISELADRVLLFNAGQIVFDGTHRELVQLREIGMKQFAWQTTNEVVENEVIAYLKASAVLIDKLPALRTDIECDVKIPQQLVFSIEIAHLRQTFVRTQLTSVLDAESGRRSFQLDIPLEMLNEHTYAAALIVTSTVGSTVHTLRIDGFLTIEVTEGPIVGRRYREGSAFSFDFGLEMKIDGESGKT